MRVAKAALFFRVILFGRSCDISCDIIVYAETRTAQNGALNAQAIALIKGMKT